MGRGPTWVVDPGPALDAHVAAVAEAVEARGGAAGIALTHRHADHAGALKALRERLGGPPGGAVAGPAHITLRDGGDFGPLRAHHGPGPTRDPLGFVARPGCVTREPGTR